MRLRCIVLAIAAVFCLLALREACAQSFGGTRSGSSGFGSSGLGSSGFGSSGFGSSGFGSSGIGGGGSFGSSGFGGSSFGSSGFGSSGFGSSGFGGGTGFGGASPFMLQGANNGFVGRTQAGMNALFQNTTPTQNNFSSGNFQFQQQQRTQPRQQQNTQSAQNTPPPVRVRLNVAFETPAPMTSTLIAPTVTRLSEELGIVGAEVEMDGETAVLRGTVASDAERRLAGRIMMMEPGVWDVRNELVVAESVEPSGTVE